MIHLINNQRGAATLFMSLVVLVLVTLVIIYSARTINLELKTTANHIRADQAFEAAESGLNYALEYFKGVELDCSRNVDDAPDTCDNDTGNLADIGTPSFILNVGDDRSVTSQGFSDDQTATRTITVDVGVSSPLPNPPDNPWTSRGSTTIGGSATILNPEGHTTVWSGQATSDSSSNSPSGFVANPAHVAADNAANIDYPACMDTPMACSLVNTSNKNSKGLDIIEFDASIGNLTKEEFFLNYFGDDLVNSLTDFKEQKATTIVTSQAQFDALLNSTNGTSEVIYVTVDVTWNGGSMGCTDAIGGMNATNGSGWLPGAYDAGGTGDNETDPVDSCINNDGPFAGPSLIVFEGNLTTKGNPNGFGIVYVHGDLDASGGTWSQHGAVIIAGNAEGSGSLDVWYNSNLMDAVAGLGNYGVVFGSWRDW